VTDADTRAAQVAEGSARLTELSRRLDDTAGILQDAALDGEEAKRLAASCAELAAEAAAELDRLTRAEPLDPPPGQEELL
jgi:hypothetical protein